MLQVEYLTVAQSNNIWLIKNKAGENQVWLQL